MLCSDECDSTDARRWPCVERTQDHPLGSAASLFSYQVEDRLLARHRPCSPIRRDPALWFARDRENEVGDTDDCGMITGCQQFSFPHGPAAGIRHEGDEVGLIQVGADALTAV